MTRAAVLWFSLAVFCGVMLYITSQRVTDGLSHLAFIRKTLQQEEESQRVLQAEWSYLNQPDRLEKLTREHLDLAPFKPRQFSTMDKIGELRAITPAAGAAPAAVKPDETVSAPPAIKKAPPPKTAAVKASAPLKIPVSAAPRPVQAAAPASAVTTQRAFNDVLKSLGGKN